jgi:signal transduction histidine kinase
MFYQTLWFRALIIGVIAGGLVFYYRIRIEAVRRLERLRFRIAHDLHDEAGSNLASIRLLSRRAAKRVQASDSSIPELAEIHRISEATAESIRSVVWLVDPRFDTLDQLLKGMETFAARLDGEIACDINWTVDRLDRPLSVEFRSHFFLAFKEILHNIQKHARATRVEISLSEEQGFFILHVHDNGVGFDVQSESQGHGLAGLRSRSAQLGGHATIESRPSQGTSVTLRVKSPF